MLSAKAFLLKLIPLSMTVSPPIEQDPCFLKLLPEEIQTMILAYCDVPTALVDRLAHYQDESVDDLSLLQDGGLEIMDNHLIYQPDLGKKRALYALSKNEQLLSASFSADQSSIAFLSYPKKIDDAGMPAMQIVAIKDYQNKKAKPKKYSLAYSTSYALARLSLQGNLAEDCFCNKNCNPLVCRPVWQLTISNSGRLVAFEYLFNIFLLDRKTEKFEAIHKLSGPIASKTPNHGKIKGTTCLAFNDDETILGIRYNIRYLKKHPALKKIHLIHLVQKSKTLGEYFEKNRVCKRWD